MRELSRYAGARMCSLIFLPLLGVGGFSLCHSSPLLTVVAYSAFIDVLLALYPGLVLWGAAIESQKEDPVEYRAWTWRHVGKLLHQLEFS